MIYLSKGMLQENVRGTVKVNRYGQLMTLEGRQAADWLRGRQAPQYLGQCRLSELESMGLVETQPGKEFLTDVFRALTRCVIAPRSQRAPYWGLSTMEKNLLRFIREAGMRLTVAELVRIRELKLAADESYLGIEQRQRLVSAIYDASNIEDGVLEAQMERSEALEETVAALLTLLQKRRIILL